MASSQVVIMTAMAVLLAVVSAAHAADAPAPSPTSPASVISPSFAVGFLTAAVALVFGSSLRIWTCCAPPSGFSLSFLFFCVDLSEIEAWLVVEYSFPCIDVQRFHVFVSGSYVILLSHGYYHLLTLGLVHNEFYLIFYFGFFFLFLFSISIIYYFSVLLWILAVWLVVPSGHLNL